MWELARRKILSCSGGKLDTPAPASIRQIPDNRVKPLCFELGLPVVQRLELLGAQVIQHPRTDLLEHKGRKRSRRRRIPPPLPPVLTSNCIVARERLEAFPANMLYVVPGAYMSNPPYETSYTLPWMAT